MKRTNIFIFSNINIFYFFILMLSLCFQNITLINFGSFNFKLYHFIGIIGIFLLLKKKDIKLPNVFLVFFVLTLCCISAIGYIKFGFNSLIFNYIFGLYILILMINLGKNISFEEWLKIGKIVASIIMLLTLARFITNKNYILNMLRSNNVNGHTGEIIGTFFGGGSNLEATWIALFSFFFYKDKKQLLYFLLSLIVSIVYLSRTGIIINLIGMLFLLFQKDEIKKHINLHKIVFLVFFTSVFLLFLYKQGLLTFILNRFISLGADNDNGAMGRLSMWRYIINAFIIYPFGYGIGNAIKGVELQSGLSYSVGNVHNIYFQMLLDGGIAGFLYYIIIILKFFLKEIKNFFTNPFSAFIITYLLIGIIQFRGGDAILFYVIGIYLILSKEKNSIYEQKKY